MAIAVWTGPAISRKGCNSAGCGWPVIRVQTRLPIAATLRSSDARWCFSQCIREGLPALRSLKVGELANGLVAVAGGRK